jgi:hypothetical protein
VGVGKRELTVKLFNFLFEAWFMVVVDEAPIEEDYVQMGRQRLECESLYKNL